MPLYNTYKFSNHPQDNRRMSLDFLRTLLGVGFEEASAEEMDEALSNIYINGQSLKGTDIEEAANLLRECFDVESRNTAMFRDNDGSFKAFESDNYISMRNNNKGKIHKTDENTAKKNSRDNEFIAYMNGIDSMDIAGDSSIIKVQETDNDLEYIKRVTGMDNIDESNINTALESIFIDGISLSDQLGEEADTEQYANALRQALSPKSSSFVTVMQRNSVFSQPKAVLPELDDYREEPGRTKVNNTLAYVKSYRNSMSNEANLCSNELYHTREEMDTRIFFASLFSPENDFMPNVNTIDSHTLSSIDKKDLRRIDPNKMELSAVEDAVGMLFNNITENFVSDRKPQDLVYAYMLTRINPKTQKNFTLDEILTDDSDFMTEQKRAAGLEFCRIFQRVTNKADEQQLNIDHYNEETYPTMREITKRLAEIKAPMYELNNREGVRGAYLSSFKSHLAHDCLQQIEKASNLKDVLAGIQGMIELHREVLTSRLDYIESDTYVNNDISRQTFRAASAEAIMKHCSIDRTEDIPLVLSDSAADRRLTFFLNDIRGDVIRMAANREFDIAGNAFTDDDLDNFINGEPNKIDDCVKSGDNAKILETIAEDIKKTKEEPITGDNILEQKILDTGKVVQPDILMEELKDYFTNGAYINAQVANSSEIQCEGACVSMLTRLTGFPFTRETDKKQLKAALDCIHIGSKTATEYFGVQGEPDYDSVKAIEKKIAEKIFKNIENKDNEFVSCRAGKNDFDMVPVKVDFNAGNRPLRPKLERLKTDEEKKAAMDKYNESMFKYKRDEKLKSQLNSYNKKAEAYSKLLSATAKGVELMESAKELASNGVKAPGHYIDFANIQELAKGNKYNELICAFTGKENTVDALNMAEKLIINGKPVSKAEDYINAPDDNAKIRAMGNIIKQAFEDNMNNDNWLKPIMLVNEKGEPEPVKFTFDVPKMPKKVEKLTGFNRFMTGKETRAAYDKAYAEYPEKLQAYNEKMAVINRLEEYNLAADMKRAEDIRKLKGIVPEVKTTNVDTLNRSRTNGAANTPQLVQPVNEARGSQQQRGMSNS